MRVAIHGAAAVKKATNFKVLTSGGLKPVAAARIRTAGGLKRFWASLSAGSTVTVAPNFVSGGRSSFHAVLVRTRTTTVTVTGGSPPYSYAWNYVSGALLDIDYPTSATTSFSADCDPGDDLTGVFNCTVTDSTGASVVSPDVTAHVVNPGI